MNQQGHHSFCCKRNNGKIFRHNALNSLVKREVEKCDAHVNLEPNNLIPNCTLRPDGATINAWTKGKPPVLDITCTHTLSNSNLLATGGAPSKADELAEAKKKKQIFYFQFFTPFHACGNRIIGPLWTCNQYFLQRSRKATKRNIQIQFGRSIFTSADFPRTSER